MSAVLVTLTLATSSDALGSGPISTGVATGATTKNPPPMVEALKLYKAQRYLAASQQLFELRRSGEYPDHNVALDYYLARCLQAMDLPHAAQVGFVQVAKSGPDDPYFPYALPQLAKTATDTTDDSTLRVLANTWEPAAFPPELRDQMHYLRGLDRAAAGHWDDALTQLDQVSIKAATRPQATFVAGVAHAKSESPEVAAELFMSLAQGADSSRAVTGRATPSTRLKWMSNANLGRTHYSTGDYEAAASAYALVPKTSPIAPRVHLELAWTAFITGRFDDAQAAIDAMDGLTTPARRRARMLKQGRGSDIVWPHWSPERHYLQALLFAATYRYQDADSHLAAFEQTYRPIQEQLAGVLQSHSERPYDPDRAPLVDAVLGTEGTARVPVSLAADVLADPRTRGLLAQVDWLDAEQASVSLAPPAWRNSVGALARRTLDGERARVMTFATVRIGNDLARAERHLRGLLDASQGARALWADQVGPQPSLAQAPGLALEQHDVDRQELWDALAVPMPEALQHAARSAHSSNPVVSGRP